VACVGACGCAFALAALAAASGVRAQEPEPGPDRRPFVFPADTQVVILDMVARDRKGLTVRDLRPDEIQVLEDGVRQDIARLEFVSQGRPTELTRPASAAVPRESGGRVESHPNLITLVFDQLGPEARLRARRAGLDELLRVGTRTDVLVSVFTVGDRLRLVHQFTNDVEALRDAIDRATSMPPPDFPGVDDGIAQASKVLAESREQLERTRMQGTSATATLGRLGYDVAVAEMMLNALKMTETLQREQQGNASLFALLALARQQRSLAGRKAIVLFSEGIQVPPHLEEIFRSVVSEANRANASVYAVDARGLMAASTLADTKEFLGQAREASLRSATSPTFSRVTREEVFATDTAETGLRMNVQDTLGDLAESTGGSLIANTNNVRPGIARIIDDMAGYYQLTYSSKNEGFDGRFRKVLVKVNRPGLTIQTRAGYYALPPGEGRYTFPFELPLMMAVKAEPVPDDFPFRARAFHFGAVEEGLRHTVAVEVGLKDLLREWDKKTKRPKSHFSFLIVLRDGTGKVVHQASHDSPIEMPREQKATPAAGTVTFLRSFDLAPGRYTLEAAVVDQLARKASVRRSVVLVPSSRPSLSSLALIKRTEPVPASALASDDKFRLGGIRIVPHVAEPTLLGVDSLRLFLVAFPASPVGEAPQLTLEFSLDGVTVARSTPQLPEPDAEGQISYVATLPASDLAPGRYQVKALLQQGGLQAAENAFFTIGE
jgi:VWFA-related protein